MENKLRYYKKCFITLKKNVTVGTVVFMLILLRLGKQNSLYNDDL